MTTMENEKKEIARIAKKYAKVQNLMKYVNQDTLKEMYKRQPKNKAVGTDGMTKEAYGENLDENIEKLLKDMKQFSYRPYPVRKVYIPKGNGKMRGLGIPSFEDKMVQGVFKEILEAIYETKFLDCSFGFRPGRSCHDAIQRINKHIMADKVDYIIDADIKGFFDNIDHDWMIRFLEHDIADKNFIRYIKRFLIGGVMEDGKKLETDKGTVQGGLISPILANVYLHYVLDLWVEHMKKKFRGEIHLVRYADDFICMFQYEKEAQAFYKLLIERLRKFNLEIAEDKSRILPFGRYKGTKESFDFLGFTHINGKSHWGKYCVIHRTSKKKLKQKRKAVKQWLKENMHESIPTTIERLNRKMIGHYRYYGIYGNSIGLWKFYKYVVRQFYFTKRRRDQTSWLTWKKLNRILKIHPIIRPKIYLTSAY
ncbi:group II intron reverse transcriptase/maturase [Erysipelotrichaceae bacterium 66-17]